VVYLNGITTKQTTDTKIYIYVSVLGDLGGKKNAWHPGYSMYGTTISMGRSFAKCWREGLRLAALTGGTAASRGYLQHRFSDDLDLFTNDAAEFPLWSGEIGDASQYFALTAVVSAD
jgi:hypothetical protein